MHCGLQFLAVSVSLSCWICSQNPKQVEMPEWNEFYQNEDDEEAQEEGEQSGGEMKAFTLFLTMTDFHSVLVKDLKIKKQNKV